MATTRRDEPRRGARRLRFATPSPFATVTALAALVVAASGALDALTSAPGRLGDAWTWVWSLVSFGVAALPLALGRRLPTWVGVVGAAVFLGVTSVQVAVSEQAVVAVNNVVLYPMVACYLGWFYRRRTARLVVGAGFTASGLGTLVNPQHAVMITWVNVALASLFCLEAASFLRRSLDRQIETDPLTGALNRTGFHRRIAAELARATRSGSPLALLMLDLDDFKRINDEGGHAAGDRTLVDLVAGIRAHARAYDCVARIGGDEFVVLLPETTPAEAAEFADRLAAVGAVAWSCGFAFGGAGDTVDDLLARADAQLYAAKRTPRTVRRR